MTGWLTARRDSSDVFADRPEAGRALATVLTDYAGPDTVVLGVPRGGVVVGAEVARALEAPLDVVIARKIGHPDQPELAVGAVVGEEGYPVLNDELVAALRVPEAYLQSEIARQREEICRRSRLYRGDAPPAPLAGKVVIVVDDGVATGYTLKAAVAAVRAAGPARLIVAVPVASEQAVEMLRPLVDELVCLRTPPFFQAVGLHFTDFSQVTDAEVTALLAAARGSPN